MGTEPEYIDYYTNDDIELRVYHFNDPVKVSYWLKGGVGFIEFDEERFEKLIELIREYDNSTRPKGRKRTFFKKKRNSNSL